jgi:ABC-type bacteriocin/lantibiotic exporter with double-glycine peptidase domain
MTFIRQRNKKDCGVACLAMLCNVTYEEANRAIPWRREGNLEGTTTKQLREGARKLGHTTESTPQDRLKPLRDSTWTDIPNNSLVKVPHPKGPDYGWHWVVWKKGKIYDPARGVFRTFRDFSPPSSYMEFMPCTN